MDMSEQLRYNKSNLSETAQSVSPLHAVSDQVADGGHTMANSPILAASPDSANSLNHNREEVARQLLPLLQQFMATYSHADLSMTPLGESFRRIIFNAQYYAAQGGGE